jgi:hypothetical protein
LPVRLDPITASFFAVRASVARNHRTYFFQNTSVLLKADS